MKHKVEITTESKMDTTALISKLHRFDFDLIRPMSKTLCVNRRLEELYGHHGRILWIDTKINANSRDVYSIYQSDEYLRNFVVSRFKMSMNEVLMHYDKKVALARKKVRTFPILNREDKLHPYGFESMDKSYLFDDETSEPKCQADILYIGKVTLSNMILYGAFARDEWVSKNWGSEKPKYVRYHIESESLDTLEFEFETDLTIFPLLEYVIKLLEEYKIQIRYSYGTNESQVVVLKPFDSDYFTEV